MRIVYVTGKILDESLSAPNILSMLGVLATHHQLHVVARYRDSRTANARLPFGLSTIRAPKLPGLSMAYFIVAAALRLWRLVSDIQPDVIVVQPAGVPVVMLLSLLRRRQENGIPIHLDVRTLPVPGRSARALGERLFLSTCVRAGGRTCSGFSAITPGAAKWVAERVRVHSDRVTVWGGGVDAQLFDRHCSSDREPARTSGIRLLYHGVVYLSRGLDRLVEAVSGLKREGPSGVSLSVVGDGPDLAELRRLAHSLDVSDCVHFIPRVPLEAMPSVIADHDVGIIPLPPLECWRTSAPTKLFEYLSMGVPVIATDIEAHRSILADVPCVEWAGNGTTPELAAAIVRARQNIEALTAGAVEGRRLVQEAYSWEAQVGRLELALNELVANRRAIANTAAC